MKDCSRASDKQIFVDEWIGKRGGTIEKNVLCLQVVWSKYVQIVSKVKLLAKSASDGMMILNQVRLDQTFDVNKNCILAAFLWKKLISMQISDYLW